MADYKAKYKKMKQMYYELLAKVEKPAVKKAAVEKPVVKKTAAKKPVVKKAAKRRTSR
jgi:hypothetical protein